MNIFLQLEANPVQMCLLYFYPAVLVNSKLDYYYFARGGGVGVEKREGVGRSVIKTKSIKN